MARTPFRAAIAVSGASYSVPSGKIAVFSLFVSQAQAFDFRIAGVTCFQANTSTGTGHTETYKPLTAKGGDVIDATNGTSGNGGTLVGFLYDS